MLAHVGTSKLTKLAMIYDFYFNNRGKLYVSRGFTLSMAENWILIGFEAILENISHAKYLWNRLNVPFFLVGNAFWGIMLDLDIR